MKRVKLFALLMCLLSFLIVTKAQSVTSATVSLTINGTGFVQGAIVNAAGAACQTTFVSPTQLTANCPYPGAITVSNPLPPAPVITSASTAGGMVGTSFAYQITASNNPTSYSATGLPSGLSVDAMGGLISGTPTAANTTNVAVGATNAGGTGTGTLILTIGPPQPPPPSITSPVTASGTVGTAFSYQITATNSPTSFSTTGLPGGLSVNTTTGLISGTPQAAGASSVALNAVNAGGVGHATLTLTVGGVTTCSTTPCSLFTGKTPNQVQDNLAPIQLGVRFFSDINGSLTAIKFFKPATDKTVVHTVNLWNTTTRTVIASAVTTSETASGWQTATFSSPVAIVAATQYVASYGSPGPFNFVRPAFTTQYDATPLHAVADSTGTPDGPFASGTNYPNVSFQATNYFIDIVFTTSNAPPAHTVALSWTASTSAGLVGYNVKRSTTNGSGYNQIGNTPTTPGNVVVYVDGTVQGGSTYYYVLTSLAPNCPASPSCGESQPTSQVAAVVSSP